MNLPPWETHDRLCPNRRPTVAFPNSACSGCRAVVAARAEGYARGLIEGDHGGRREGYRSGYDAGKDAVMTDSYAQAVAAGQRDEREACIAVVEAHIRADLTEQAMFCGRKSDLIAAIRAREEKPNG